ncbi:glycosyltransferase [Erwinia rhapontici]|uniref:glycosyltransferase n=1 Tax=Erwinia rhapontici TaxID=55212 RepID=UPI0014382B14|nr:glycosyltransferase [Erwinia rhapontici]NKG32782.1 glycosyltransferase [Erwinia rhapontici]
MKRVHVINLEKMGGAEKVFIEYMRSKTQGEDCILCISQHVADEISKELKSRDIVFVNRIFSGLSLKYPSFLRKRILPLKIARQQPDVVVFWDLVPRRFKKSANYKSFYYDHGASWRYANNDEIMTFFSSIDGAIAVSQASQRIMQQRFALKAPVEIIPNLLTKAVFTPSPDKKPPSRTGVTLGIASRLVSLKGIGVSIMAVAELRQRGINARLKIAGKGTNEEALKALVKKLNIEPYVDFMGFQQSLTDFYTSIDFYMSMSISESYGLSCADAINHGVPCIYSLIDGQCEVIENGITGIGITPTMAPEEYESKSGYMVEKPYFSYDPVTDTLVSPKMVDPIICADVIEKNINTAEYSYYLEKIHNHNKNIAEPVNLSKKINNHLSYQKKIK